MRGPRYLSLLAHDDFYCGGAYPDTDQIALVFDLRTGAPINWKRLFPAGFIDAAGPSPGGGESQPITVSSSALWKLYAQMAAADLKNKDCADVLANPSGVGTGLMLWPDDETDGLSIQQADFPHVVKACGPAETIHRHDLANSESAPPFSPRSTKRTADAGTINQQNRARSLPSPARTELLFSTSGLALEPSTGAAPRVRFPEVLKDNLLRRLLALLRQPGERA